MYCSWGQEEPIYKERQDKMNNKNFGSVQKQNYKKITLEWRICLKILSPNWNALVRIQFFI